MHTRARASASPTEVVAQTASPADSLRALLKGPGLSLAWFSLGSVPLIEIAARKGFDAAVIDLQHGLWDRMSTHLAVSVLRDVPVIARVAAVSAAAIGEALDSGAAGILVPLVETAEQARLAVAAAMFPPDGIRSGGGVRPLAQGFANYVRDHGRPLIGVMIETIQGVENAAAIAATPGIDLVLIGTGDLALSIGCFPQIDDRHEQAIRTVQDACRDVGLPCAIFTTSIEAAQHRREQGFAATVAANDIAIVTGGFAAAADRLNTTRG